MRRADIYRKAADILRGQDTVSRGFPVNEEEDGRVIFSLEGAIEFAQDHRTSDDEGIDDTVLGPVATVIVREYGWLVGSKPPMTPGWVIFTWNDEPGRTGKEAAAVLDKARELIAASPGVTFSWEEQ